MSRQQCEVYVACKDRSVALAREFLDAVLPDRAEVAEEYLYPEYADEPEAEFNDADALMARLETDQAEGYGIYWDRVGSGDPHQAMLFFTEDGGLVAGVATFSENAVALLEKVAAAVHGRFGYVTFEERPPDLVSDFFSRCRSANGTRLVDGKIVQN